MTDEIGSLTILIRHGKVTKETHHFYEKWKYYSTVIDKWFSIQSTFTSPSSSVRIVSNLSKHSAFNMKNPNRFNSVIGTFASNNFLGFHQQDGKGYKLVTDWLIKLDKINPQTTARVCKAFENWKLFDLKRQLKISENLTRLSQIPNISKNTYEVVNTMLKK